MKTASVVDLKTHLGRYLGLVEHGETILVTSHRHPVARLVGLERSTDRSDVLPPERPVSNLAGIGPVKLARQVDGVASLLGDRNRR